MDIPYWDEWLTAGFYIRLEDGLATMSDWFAWHNACRPFVPRLLYALQFFTVGWHPTWFMYLSTVVTLGSGFLCFRQLARSVENPKWLLPISLFLGLWIFSPAGYQNHLWGCTFVSAVPTLCVLLSLTLQQSKWSDGIVLLGGVFFSLIAQWTYTHGLFAWFACFPWLRLADKWSVQRRFSLKNCWPFILYFVVAGICILTFLSGFKSDDPDRVVHVARSFKDLADYGLFLLAWMGTPWASSLWISYYESIFYFSSALYALIIGFWVALLCAFLFFEVWVLLVRHRQYSFIKGPFYFWFVLLAFTVMAGSLTTLGRVSFGISTALMPRYLPVSVWLAPSIFGLICCIWKGSKEVASPQQQGRLKMIFLFFAVISMGALPALWAGGLKAYVNEYYDRSRLVLHLRLAEQIHDFDDAEVPGIIGKPQTFWARAFMAKNTTKGKALPIELIGGWVIPHIIPGKISSEDGKVDIFVNQDRSSIQVTGWAKKPNKSDPASFVIVVVRNNANEAFLLDGLNVNQHGVDLPPGLKTGWRRQFGFSGNFKLAIPRATQIEIYAVDDETHLLSCIGISELGEPFKNIERSHEK